MPAFHAGALRRYHFRRRPAGVRSEGWRNARRELLPASEDCRLHYTNLSSVLRRNQHMLSIEQQHLNDRLADTAPGSGSYWDLLLYEFLGHESRRSKEAAAAFRQRRLHLTRLEVLLSHARTALDAGNTGLAERILRHTSPALGVLVIVGPPPAPEDLPPLGEASAVL